MKSQPAKLVADEHATTDIFHEPITAWGFHPAYCITGGRAPDGEPIGLNVGLEVLLPLVEAEAFKAKADRFAKKRDLGRDPCEIVYDGGDVPWCIVEAVVPRAMACDLIHLAQDMGCKRRPTR